jgi:hypothetical protein
MNPYKQLYPIDPFGIFPQLACGEAFKKIACAGCDGRVKTEQQDLLEAIDTVERIIKDTDNDVVDVFLVKTDADIDRIMRRYIEVFGDSQRMTAARLLLEFVATNNVEKLERCLTLLKKLV